MILLWHDKTIDCESADRIIIPGVYIVKGRTLTLKNPADKMEIVLGKILHKIEGNIRVAKKPIEKTPEELQEMAARCLCGKDWSGMPGPKPACPVHDEIKGSPGK